MMDSISELRDALLLKILCLLPAKDVVVTMVLSKRWQPLWTMVPKLLYDDSYQNMKYGTFSRFVDRSLFLHEAPVLETLHFKLGKTCGAEDIRVWIRAADKCFVRELIMEFDNSSSASPAILPRSLYTGCRNLVTLKLNNAILVDVASLVSFPSLLTLDLLYVKYPGDEFVKRFLSNCPVLEALVVRLAPDDNVTIFTVIVPSLKSLTFCVSLKCVKDDACGFAIDAPSLEFFDIIDHRGGFCVFENNTPKIVEADVDVLYVNPGKILSSITSVKWLYLCLRHLKDAYPVGSVFHGLLHLMICTCETEWLNLHMCLLRDSPKLQSLKLIKLIFQSNYHELCVKELRPCWNKPCSIPECMISSLETLEWVNYEGTEEEKELVGFILRTGSCVKNVTISSKTTDNNKKLEMIKELTLPSRRSPTCELAFH